MVKCWPVEISAGVGEVMWQFSAANRDLELAAAVTALATGLHLTCPAEKTAQTLAGYTLQKYTFCTFVDGYHLPIFVA